MNASELARLMLYWEDQKKGLTRTEERIKEAVLELGETVDTGNVRASYSKGRRKFDYLQAVAEQPKLAEADVTKFTTVIPQTEKVDWKAVCKHFGIKDIPFTQSEPGVTVKLLS